MTQICNLETCDQQVKTHDLQTNPYHYEDNELDVKLWTTYSAWKSAVGSLSTSEFGTAENALAVIKDLTKDIAGHIEEYNGHIADIGNNALQDEDNRALAVDKTHQGEEELCSVELDVEAEEYGDSNDDVMGTLYDRLVELDNRWTALKDLSAVQRPEACLINSALQSVQYVSNVLAVILGATELTMFRQSRDWTVSDQSKVMVLQTSSAGSKGDLRKRKNSVGFEFLEPFDQRHKLNEECPPQAKYSRKKECPYDVITRFTNKNLHVDQIYTARIVRNFGLMDFSVVLEEHYDEHFKFANAFQKHNDAMGHKSLDQCSTRGDYALVYNSACWFRSIVIESNEYRHSCQLYLIDQAQFVTLDADQELYEASAIHVEDIPWFALAVQTIQYPSTMSEQFVANYCIGTPIRLQFEAMGENGQLTARVHE